MLTTATPALKLVPDFCAPAVETSSIPINKYTFFIALSSELTSDSVHAESSKPVVCLHPWRIQCNPPLRVFCLFFKDETQQYGAG